MQALNCGVNQLSSLPSLPAGLMWLSCDSNQLTSLPALPHTLYTFTVGHNPQLACMPPLMEFAGPSNFFYIGNTGISCLSNVVQHSGFIPAIDTMPLCEPINPNGCEPGWNAMGMVYFDGDDDCTFGSTESTMHNVKLSLSQNGGSAQSVFTNYNGLYSFLADTLLPYTVSIDTSELYFSVTCPDDNLYTQNPSVNPFSTGLDFALKCKPGFDVGVQSIVQTLGMLFPGQTATVQIHAGDLAQYFGTSCNTDGLFGELTATFTGPAGVASISAPGGVSGNTITWPVMDMSQWNYSVILGLDSTAQSGDQICFDVTLTASTGTDNNQSNNTLTHCFTVVNSYDPNFKEVFPTTPQPSSWYTYTVHFQNTGTAAAQHIVIKDTLDSNLDWTSFQRLGASHNDLTQVFENGVVHFNFPNINLPDSNSNEPESHGWVQYRVKSKSTVDPFSTVIHNTASIYFDFNAPIVTNDALVEYSTSIATVPAIDFQLYPNPTADHVTIVLPKEHPNALVAVYDLTGREVVSTTPVNAQVRLQTRVLCSGVYHVAMLVNGKSIGGKKLVVVR
jgi:uncharacterized repeat protein (TIGR01451 family)